MTLKPTVREAVLELLAPFASRRFSAIRAQRSFRCFVPFRTISATSLDFKNRSWVGMADGYAQATRNAALVKPALGS